MEIAYKTTARVHCYTYILILIHVPNQAIRPLFRVFRPIMTRLKFTTFHKMTPNGQITPSRQLLGDLYMAYMGYVLYVCIEANPGRKLIVDAP